MDSITKAINTWLLTYKPILDIADEIHTEELTDDYNNLALQRTGVELVSQYLVGKKEQYQYILYLKSASEDDIAKINNLDWLDNLNDWIYEQNLKRNMPIIENKKCIKISCANGLTYETEEDGSISNYGLQLYFDIQTNKTRNGLFFNEKED